MKRLNRRIHFFIISWLALMFFSPYMNASADTQNLENKLNNFILHYEESIVALATIVDEGNEVNYDLIYFCTLKRSHKVGLSWLPLSLNIIGM